jgi:cell division protein FtsB
MAREMSGKDGLRGRLSNVWLAVIVIAGILILGDLNRRMTDARRLEQDSLILQEQVASLEAEELRLQTQIAGATSEESVEAWAHDQAKMVREGERLVVPIPQPGATVAAAVPSAADSETTSNWQLWWTLLFGSQP